MKKNNQVSKEVIKAVKRNRELRAQMAALQTQLEATTTVIRGEAERAPDGRLTGPDFTVVLYEVNRDVFSLQDARKALGERVLKPFIKTTSYTTLRIN